MKNIFQLIPKMENESPEFEINVNEYPLPTNAKEYIGALFSLLKDQGVKPIYIGIIITKTISHYLANMFKEFTNIEDELLNIILPLFKELKGRKGPLTIGKSLVKSCLFILSELKKEEVKDLKNSSKLIIWKNLELFLPNLYEQLEATLKLSNLISIEEFLNLD